MTMLEAPCRRSRTRELTDRVLELLGDRLPRRPEPHPQAIQEFAKFKAWCRRCGHNSMPAAGPTVAAYLMAVMSDFGSVARTEAAAAAIEVVHQANGHGIDPGYLRAALTWARESWEGAQLLNGGTP